MKKINILFLTISIGTALGTRIQIDVVTTYLKTNSLQLEIKNGRLTTNVSHPFFCIQFYVLLLSAYLTRERWASSPKLLL